MIQVSRGSVPASVLLLGATAPMAACMQAAPSPSAAVPESGPSQGPVKSATRPSFPSQYATPGRTGFVKVACDIEVDGRPTNCELREVDGGSAFGTAVLAWLRSGGVRYKPAMANGHPVRAEGHITTLTFKLGN